MYVGVTSDLAKRIWQHREGSVDGFTRRPAVRRLVYFEMHDSMASAIEREKRIKNWKRAWKVKVIEAGNPEWRDLYDSIF